MHDPKAVEGGHDRLLFRSENRGVIGYGCQSGADVIVPALLAGHGLALQPTFLVWDALQSGELEEVMHDWKIADINVNLVTPPGMLRAARVTALLDFLVEHLSHAPWALPPV
jgi:DNA-binding transcriptional LysR family regulator